MSESDMPKLETLLDRIRNHDDEAVAEMFAHYRTRLKRMVQLRMDRRLQGRVDASDVLHEAYIDVATRAEEYANKPEMPFSSGSG